MDAHTLWTSSGLSPWLVAVLVFAPAVFILFSRRAGRRKKIVWVLASQLPWLFALAYFWVWHERYADPTASMEMQFVQSPVNDAVGWWTVAFPWGIYLWFRATRAWFAGEDRPGGGKTSE